MQHKDELAKPIAGQFQTSIFWLGLGALVLGVPVLAAEIAFVNRILPAEDAARIKDFVFTTVLGTGGTMLLRSLLLTALKGAARLKGDAPKPE